MCSTEEDDLIGGTYELLVGAFSEMEDRGEHGFDESLCPAKGGWRESPQPLDDAALTEVRQGPPVEVADVESGWDRDRIFAWLTGPGNLTRVRVRVRAP